MHGVLTPHPASDLSLSRGTIAYPAHSTWFYVGKSITLTFFHVRRVYLEEYGGWWNLNVKLFILFQHSNVLLRYRETVYYRWGYILRPLLDAMFKNRFETRQL